MSTNKTFHNATPEALALAEESTHGYALLAKQTNEIGWELCAYRVPNYHGTTLEFVQINNPDGTSAYFRKGAGRELEAGPFGGGYSWSVPKYVVKAAHDLFFETFTEAPAAEEMPAA
jgi:hypothetical protein